MLRKVFGPKRDEVTGVEKTIQGETFYSVFVTKYSGDKVKRNKMGGVCSRYWGEKRCIKGFGGKT